MRNEIIKNYMRYLKLGRNFSKNTLDAYYHDLNFLLEYADKNNLVLTEMKLEDLENFSAICMIVVFLLVHKLGF